MTFGWLLLRWRKLRHRLLLNLLQNRLLRLFVLLLLFLLVDQSFPAFGDGVVVLVPHQGCQPTAQVSQNWMISHKA